MKKITALALAFAFSSPVFAATSVKTYGVVAEVDLSGLPQIPSDFQMDICQTSSPSNCGASAIDWNIQDQNPADGDVDNPGNGMMNQKGWLVANQFVRISNLRANTPGWTLSIYTDNLNPNASPVYTGPTVGQGAVGGLISEDGKERISLGWKLWPTPISFRNEPLAEEALSLQRCPNGFQRETDGFCDFSSHYMADLGDRNPNSPRRNELIFWSRMECNFQEPAVREACEFTRKQNRNYQSVFTSEGAGTGEIYRSPYPTFGDFTGHLYLIAKFESGTFPSVYATRIYLEFLSI